MVGGADACVGPEFVQVSDVVKRRFPSFEDLADSGKGKTPTCLSTVYSRLLDSSNTQL